MNMRHRLIIGGVSILGMQQLFSSAPLQSIQPIDEALLRRCDERIEVAAPASAQRLGILRSYVDRIYSQQAPITVQPENDRDTRAVSSQELEHETPVFLSMIVSFGLGAIFDKLQAELEELSKIDPSKRMCEGSDGSIMKIFPYSVTTKYNEIFRSLSMISEHDASEFNQWYVEIGEFRGMAVRLLSEEESREYLRRNCPALLENGGQNGDDDDDLYPTR